MKYIYAALLLHKTGKEINEENLKKVVAATGEEIDENKVKSLITSLKGVDIDKELENAKLVSSSAETDKTTSVEEKKEEKPKEEKKEAAAEGLSALFG
jgi:large subunit ribosomal protein L12